jgi:hypothetical protein
MLRWKYLKNKTIGMLLRSRETVTFGQDLWILKTSLWALGFSIWTTVKISSSGRISGWENFTLQQHFPSLYNIVRRKNTLVATVFSMMPLNISFRWGLYDQNLSKWHDLCHIGGVDVQLNELEDKFWWLHQNKNSFLLGLCTMYWSVMDKSGKINWFGVSSYRSR